MSDRIFMRAPDGRTVQVMTDDIKTFELQGFEHIEPEQPDAEATETAAPRGRKKKASH